MKLSWNKIIGTGPFIIYALLIGVGQMGFSQGFVNLDFEDATVILDDPGVVEASSALPGWTPFPGNVGYDTVSLGGAAVFLEDTATPYGSHSLPIEGNYSVFLEDPEVVSETAAIGQTGTIPITTQSLTFFGNLAGNLSGGNLQVTFNGQNISYFAIGNGAAYTIYGADISAYAGQTGQLLFTTPVQTSALLDNIQFSSTAVPEPSEFALGAIGALLLGFRRWQKLSL
jgi:hypothetical protein